MDLVNTLRPVHGDEMIYLFNMVDLPSEEELEMRNIIVKYWTNFAKYGNPSMSSDDLPEWLPYSQEKVSLRKISKVTNKLNILNKGGLHKICSVFRTRDKSLNTSHRKSKF